MHAFLRSTLIRLMNTIHIPRFISLLWQQYHNRLLLAVLASIVICLQPLNSTTVGTGILKQHPSPPKMLVSPPEIKVDLMLLLSAQKRSLGEHLKVLILHFIIRYSKNGQMRRRIILSIMQQSRMHLIQLSFMSRDI